MLKKTHWSFCTYFSKPTIKLYYVPPLKLAFMNLASFGFSMGFDTCRARAIAQRLNPKQAASGYMKVHKELHACCYYGQCEAFTELSSQCEFYKRGLIEPYHGVYLIFLMWVYSDRHLQHFYSFTALSFHPCTNTRVTLETMALSWTWS